MIRLAFSHPENRARVMYNSWDVKTINQTKASFWSARADADSPLLVSPFIPFNFLCPPSAVFTAFFDFLFFFLLLLLPRYTRVCLSCRDVNRFGTNRKERPKRLIMIPEILSERYERYVKSIFIDLSKTIKGCIVLIGTFARFPRLIFSRFYAIKYVELHAFGTVLNHRTRECRTLVLVLSGNSRVSTNRPISYMGYDGDKIQLRLLRKHTFPHFFAYHQFARNSDWLYTQILII